MKRIKKVEESSALIGKVFDSFETDSHQDAPSIYAVRNAISNPNLLINGDFQIWQRGEEFSGFSGFAYTSDRWTVYKNAIDNVTIKKVDSGLQFESDNTALNIRQYLENKLEIGKPYTISASIDGVLYTTEIIGGTDKIDSFLRYESFTKNQKADAIIIKFIDTNIHVVNWVKLEQGSIATPLVPRHYAEELVLCKKYYRCCVVEGQWYVISSGVTHYSCYLDIGIMRVKPTVVNKEVRFVNVGKIDLTKLTMGNIAFDASITKTMHFTELIYNEVVQHKNNIIVKVELDAEIY